jgi:UDP-N-acetylmuramyl pentapeptide synthase
MENALNTLSDLKCKGKKIAVLADMLELGDATYSEHKEIINKATKSPYCIYLWKALWRGF